MTDAIFEGEIAGLLAAVSRNDHQPDRDWELGAPRVREKNNALYETIHLCPPLQRTQLSYGRLNQVLGLVVLSLTHITRRTIMQKFANPLKIASMVVATIGFFIATELQRRETEEIVEQVIEKREAKAKATATATRAVDS